MSGHVNSYPVLSTCTVIVRVKFKGNLDLNVDSNASVRSSVTMLRSLPLILRDVEIQKENIFLWVITKVRMLMWFLTI